MAPVQLRARAAQVAPQLLAVTPQLLSTSGGQNPMVVSTDAAR
jgi:hypothetical protein